MLNLMKNLLESVFRIGRISFWHKLLYWLPKSYIKRKEIIRYIIKFFFIIKRRCKFLGMHIQKPFVKILLIIQIIFKSIQSFLYYSKWGSYNFSFPCSYSWSKRIYSFREIKIRLINTPQEIILTYIERIVYYIRLVATDTILTVNWHQ